MSSANSKSAMTPTQVIASLSKLNGWVLNGDGPAVAIQKTYHFRSYLEVISFVNAVAFIAEKKNHHPDLQVGYSKCTVKFRTHDLQALSALDFDCAYQVDAFMNTDDQNGESTA